MEYTKTTDDFIGEYFSAGVWRMTYWMGLSLGKVPCDMIVQQELIFNLKPDTIIECGTGTGGSALFYYHCTMNAGKSAKVITIDIAPDNSRLKDDRITFITGDCTDMDVFNKVKSLTSGVTFVILDYSNLKNPVLAGLKLYSSLVTVGSYIIIDDTAQGVLWRKAQEAGPYLAVEEFLRGGDDFMVDRECEKHLLTFNRGGYLKRMK